MSLISYNNSPNSYNNSANTEYNSIYSEQNDNNRTEIENKNENSCYILSQPNEILIEIFNKLDIHSCFKINSVCKRFNAIIKEFDCMKLKSFELITLSDWENNQLFSKDNIKLSPYSIPKEKMLKTFKKLKTLFHENGYKNFDKKSITFFVLPKELSLIQVFESIKNEPINFLFKTRTGLTYDPLNAIELPLKKTCLLAFANFRSGEKQTFGKHKKSHIEKNVTLPNIFQLVVRAALPVIFKDKEIGHLPLSEKPLRILDEALFSHKVIQNISQSEDSSKNISIQAEQSLRNNEEMEAVAMFIVDEIDSSEKNEIGLFLKSVNDKKITVFREKYTFEESPLKKQKIDSSQD